MLADADDTAKSIYLLNLLGHTTSCDGMISQFMSPKGHMMTYLGERNLSQSANCNAMICILNSPELQKHSDVVSKNCRVLVRSLVERCHERQMGKLRKHSARDDDLTIPSELI